VLRGVESFETPEQVARNVVLGQYSAGSIGGMDVPGYQQERDVAPGSRTPTFVAMRLNVRSWRWDGVPFYIRFREADAQARDGDRRPLSSPCRTRLFGEGATQPNVLIVRVQPEEGIALRFSVKVPGERLPAPHRQHGLRYGPRSA